MNYIIWAICATAVFFIAVIVTDVNRFRVVTYPISSSKIKKDVTYVLLADLHNKSYGKGNQYLLQKIDEINPDGILIAGDLITASQKVEMEVPVYLLEKLHQKYPVYYGMGNHEYRMKKERQRYKNQYLDYEKKMAGAGIHIMENERLYLPESNVRISAPAIARQFYRKYEKPSMKDGYIESLVGPSEKSVYELMIAHHPGYFSKYAQWGADLVVSGHMHGGAMRLPFLGGVISPDFKLFPKYDGGLFYQNHTVMVLSRGLGMHTLPIRIFNPGELVVIKLEKTGKN